MFNLNLIPSIFLLGRGRVLLSKVFLTSFWLAIRTEESGLMLISAPTYKFCPGFRCFVLLQAAQTEHIRINKLNLISSFISRLLFLSISFRLFLLISFPFAEVSENFSESVIIYDQRKSYPGFNNFSFYNP